MPAKKILKFTITISVLLLLSVSLAYAIEDDGFGPAKRIEGKHFIIYYAPVLEVSNLVQQLNIRPSDQLLAGKSRTKRYSSEAELVDMLDTLFAQVCDVLDMQLYSWRGNLKICRDQAQLNGIYQYFFDKELKTQSFYSYALNTIYASADNFKREIIGHEIAHAVISHYFVVLPSVKVQEVLAAYVEFQLRRAAQ